MLRKAIAIVLASLSLTSAYAGGLKQGRITGVLIATSIPDKAFIRIDGSYSANQPEPSCSAGVSEWDFALDLTTLTGRALYSMVVAAQASQVTVTAEGFGTCTLRSNYEDLNYIHSDT